MTIEELRHQLQDALTLAFSPVNGGCGCLPGPVLMDFLGRWFELPGLDKRVTFEFFDEAVVGGARGVAGMLLDYHRQECRR